MSTGYPSIDKPWLKYYSQEAINEPLPECTMYEYLWENNKDHLDDVALVYFKKKITYGEMFAMIDKTARAFLSIGVKSGDVVTVLMLNQPEMVYMLYGLNKIGAVCCVVNVLSSEKELIHYLLEGKSKYFVALDVFFDKSYTAAKEYGVSKLIYIPLWQSLGAIKNKLYRLKVKKPAYSDGFVMSWNAFLAGAAAVHEVIPAKYEKNKCTVIGHTGGTTGTPKGVMLTDYAFNSVFEQEKWMFERRPNDSLMDMIVPFAIYGLASNIHIAMCFGVQLILIPKVDPEKTDELLLKYKPNHVASIPSYWTAIPKSKRLNDVSWLRTAVAGGAGMNSELENSLNDFFSSHGSTAYVTNGYGMSEVCGAACMQTKNSSAVGSVGIPLCKTVVAAFEPETTNEKKYGEIGELCIKSPCMMLGYVGNKEETAQVMKRHKDGVWIHTGDLGYVTDSGAVYVKGRIKRVYITQHNGVVSKIFPDRIEQTILAHQQVEECCAICISQKDGTYLPIAYLALKEKSADHVNVQEEVSALCKRDLPEYAQPVRYIFLNTLPKTAVGKVDYRALEAQAAKL